MRCSDAAPGQFILEYTNLLLCLAQLRVNFENAPVGGERLLFLANVHEYGRHPGQGTEMTWLEAERALDIDTPYDFLIAELLAEHLEKSGDRKWQR